MALGPRGRSRLESSFGQIVRRERLRLGMSQTQLADHAGLSREGVSKIELGKIAASIRAIDRLGVALGRKPHQLVKAAEDLEAGN
jgi:HTH-type transcriptional regulator / antitoxin HipB